MTLYVLLNRRLRVFSTQFQLCTNLGRNIFSVSELVVPRNLQPAFNWWTDLKSVVTSTTVIK